MLKMLCYALIPSMLAACGGGGGDGDSDDGDSDFSRLHQGFFIDDAVQDLTYETGGNLPQNTDENGVLSYELGQPIVFRVDDVVLGTVDEGFSRIIPSDFGRFGDNIMRFLQSIDQTPAAPGIVLTGVDLPPVQLDFGLDDFTFTNHPDVIAAVAAAGPMGGGTGTGVLIDLATARANFQASSSLNFDIAEIENLAAYPVSPSANEPCIVFFTNDEVSPNSDRFAGQNFCQDDIDDDPDDPVEHFVWRMNITEVILEFESGGAVVERINVQKRGTTGTRVHAYFGIECVPCNPNVEPQFTEEIQTLYPALPLPDLNGQTLMLTAKSDGTLVELDFLASTGTLDGGETFNWALDPEFNMLVLRGTGAPGGTLLYHRVILVDGNVNNGQLAALLAEARDTDNSGDLSDLEIANATYLGVELFNSN